MLKQIKIVLSRASGKLLRKQTAAFVFRASFAVSKAGVGAARANSCLFAHQGAWKRWVLKQGLNYVKSHIGEAEVGA